MYMATLEERLNEIIDQKDDQIYELENKIERLENEADLSRVSWQRHIAFENTGMSAKLPFPRLEMRLERTSKDNWYSIQWLYGIVYKHITAVNGPILYFVPLSLTTSSGGSGSFDHWRQNEKLQLPYRDGVHIKLDSKVFNLPAFIVCYEKGVYEKIEVDFDCSKQIQELVKQ